MPEPTRILIVDDEVEIASLLGMHLERDGYQVSLAHSGTEGLRLAYEHKPAAVILDLMMPGMDGYEACGRLRDISDAAILMVTVIKDSDSIVNALEMGADDYLIKPFDYPVLRARLEACLRRRSVERARAAGLADPTSPWSLDPTRREVVVGMKRVQLTPKEFEILRFFMENPDKVLAVDEMLENLWGPEYVGDPDLVKQFVYRLRTKLEPIPSEPQYFVTVRGSGYAFEPDTRPDLGKVVADSAQPADAPPPPEPERVSAFRRRARRRRLFGVFSASSALGQSGEGEPEPRPPIPAGESQAASSWTLRIPRPGPAGTWLLVTLAAISLLAGAAFCRATGGLFP